MKLETFQIIKYVENASQGFANESNPRRNKQRWFNKQENKTDCIALLAKSWMNEELNSEKISWFCSLDPKLILSFSSIFRATRMINTTQQRSEDHQEKAVSSHIVEDVVAVDEAAAEKRMQRRRMRTLEPRQLKSKNELFNN